MSNPLDDTPEWLLPFSPQQREKIMEILDLYLQGLERGEPLNLSLALQATPELEDPVRRYLQQLDLLHGAAAEIRNDAFAAGGASGIDTQGEHQRLGDFTLIREIGRGGMGLVYEAIQESLGRRVAIKLLPMAALFSPTQVARFRNEAQAAAQLQHPNIIPVYAIGSEKGIHYFAMPLVEGLSLDALIAEEQSPPPSPTPTHAWLLKQKKSPGGILMAKVRLIIQAAHALHAAHEVGIVHRDIKPSNLMLDTTGKLFVADFGLARIVSENNLTKTGELIGTMRYMSPEQAIGDPTQVDHRTDVYSLATTLYELLTLETAVQGEEGAALLQAIQLPIIPLRRRLPDAPRDLSTVLDKALAKDKQHRYLTAKAFAEDLQCVVEGKPTLAKPPTPLQMAGNWVGRHERAVATSLILGSIGLLLSMILLGTFAWMQQVSRGNFLRSEQHLKQARDVVDLFGTQFTDQLASVPGAEPIRQAMLRESLNYHLAFAENASNAPELQQDLALTLFRIGSLTRELDSAAEALPYFRNASRNFASIQSASHGRFGWSQAWAQNEGALALALADTDAIQEGIAVLKHLIVQLQKLPSPSPNLDDLRSSPTQRQLELARAFNHAGLLVWRAGQEQEGLALLEEAWKQVQSQPPHLEPNEIIDFLSLAAAIRENMASIFESSRPSRAAELFAESLALQEQRDQKLGIDLPSPMKARTLNSLASAERLAKNSDAAIQHFQAAIDIQKELVQASPQKTTLRRDLALSYNNVGLAFIDRLNFDQASNSLLEAKSILSELHQKYPDDLELAAGLSTTYNNLGLLDERRQRDPDAAGWYVQAINLQKRSLQLAPNSTKHRELLSTELANFSRLQRRAQQWDEAMNMAVDYRDLWKDSPSRLLAVAKEMGEICLEMELHGGGNLPATRYKEIVIQTLKMGKIAGLRLDSDIMKSIPFSKLLAPNIQQSLVQP